MTAFTRRSVLKLAGAAAALPLFPNLAAGAGPRHGISIFGDLAKPADFAHFPYVNPNAPKGGRMVMLAPFWYFNQNPQTFNTLNGFVTKGDAAPRPELTFDSLMASADDEPDSMYGLIAESVAISDDGRVYEFRLRPAARFHDDTPLTAHDVAWSFTTLKEKGHPDMRLSLADMDGAEASGDHTLVVRFSERASAQLPLTVADLPVLSRAWWQERDFEASTLEPLLGSGPYKVGRFEQGRFIEYERVADYWGSDLPLNRGQNNLDVIRIEFFRERQAGFEAFKKGDVTIREEFTSKTWAEEYDFPAIRDGRAVKTEFPAEARPKLQAWFFNTRKGKFADPRTRQAIGLAFDFEWVNRNLFYNSYTRASSYFETSVYQAHGLPSAEELALLEPFRGEIPDAAFGEAVAPAPSDGSGLDRARLREAVDLLREAGWERRDGGLYDSFGEQLTVEFMINASVFERVLGKYVEGLKWIGINATINLVDPAQFQARINDFDFDVVGRAWSLTPTPIEGVRTFFHSSVADTPSGNNLPGIRSAAVDALVDKVLSARDRDSHRTALKALDRVIRASHYTVPNWTSPSHRMAFWDFYRWPDVKPDYAFLPEQWWWYDPDKAARINNAG